MVLIYKRPIAGRTGAGMDIGQNGRNLQVDPPDGPDDALPPPPQVPAEPPERPGRPFVPFRQFAPVFLGVAALVGIERLAMIAAVSGSLPDAARWAGFGVFCATVSAVALFGGQYFHKNFGK